MTIDVHLNMFQGKVSKITFWLYPVGTTEHQIFFMSWKAYTA